MTDRLIPLDLDTPCVLSTHWRNKSGYAKTKHLPAHRVAYAEQVGPIPVGFHVDHVCWQPPCINPAHLRLLPANENRARQRSALKATCKSGHPFDDANTYIRPKRYGGGRRSCRTCNALAVRQYKARLQAAA